MILLNFSHPLASDQLNTIVSLSGQQIHRIVQVPSQLNPGADFAPQIEALVDACNLGLQEWQTEPLLIVPPSLNIAAVVLLAELHGRMGYFPSVVRFRAVRDAIPPRFEVAEIISLQVVRHLARRR